MCKLFDDWSKQIKEYCENNGFDFEKAKKMSQSWGKDILVLQFHDPEKGTKGLLDETPSPVVLLVKKEKNGQLLFETTENTSKYIGKVS